MTRFDQPMGDAAARNAMPWAGGIWSANPPYTYYQLRPGVYAYHTGDDLNPGDQGTPVYASGTGKVVFAGVASGFQDQTVCIEYLNPSGPGTPSVWTRHSHIKTLTVVEGQQVQRGTQIGVVADYNDDGTPTDHLHFDVAWIDLSRATGKPADWPGTDLARCKRDYTPPKAWIETHRTEVTEVPGAYARDVYGRRMLVAYAYDSRWPNAAGATPAQNAALEVRRRANGFSLGNSHDDAGLAVITKTGATGTETVELWGFPNEAKATFNSFYATYYPHAKLEYHAWSELIPPTQPPNPQPATHPAFEPISREQALTGMHTINWVEDARSAADLGCRMLTMLDNLSGAREMRNRGCVVIHRTWFNDPGWTPQNCFDRLGVNSDDRLILVGQNECDAGRCPGNIADLQERFRWDKEFAEICWAKAPKCFPAIGGFSVGTPPIDQGGEYAKAFRDTYGAFLNANYQKVGLNWHLYVWRRVTAEWPPPSEEIYPDQRWWAGRCKVFAYDPAYGGLNNNVISVSDEIMGECGHGGWNWAGYQPADGTRWWNYWRDLYYNFPQLKYATGFIACRSASWQGYDVRYLLAPVFKPIWTTPVPKEAEAMDAQSKDVAAPPPEPEVVEMDAQALEAHRLSFTYEGDAKLGDDDPDRIGRLMFEARRLQIEIDRPIQEQNMAQARRERDGGE